MLVMSIIIQLHFHHSIQQISKSACMLRAIYASHNLHQNTEYTKLLTIVVKHDQI